MEQTIRWGILGSGRIAGQFASDLRLVKDAELVAVGSRSQTNADDFAVRYGIKRAYGSYEALVADKDVDVVYISTPHTLHYENTLLCLRHRKAVLCEKPFAMNLQQVQGMIGLAKEKGVFLMEALWTKFLPHYHKTMELFHAGTLGEVKTVLANFGFQVHAGSAIRLTDPALGGGTVLDIGIYNVFIALSILGRPDHIEAQMTPSVDGVDEQCAVLFRYNNGAMAQLFSSFRCSLPIEAVIGGTKATLKLTGRFYEPSATLQLTEERDTQTIDVEKEAGLGYQYEARHVTECLQKGLTESTVMKFEDSLLLIETLDAIRKCAGIVYAADR